MDAHMTAYLIIHGFAGGLHEVDYLALYLRSKGLDVHTVLLSGHGGTKKELHKTSHADWIHSASEAVGHLRKEYRRIVILGFSMGGLIGARFAGLPEVQKIVFINSPIYFWNIKIILKDVFAGIWRRQYEKLKFYRKSMFGSSMKSNIDFLKILSESNTILGSVQKPALIVQCVDDESVRHKSARFIKEKLGSLATLRYYSGGCHVIFMENSETRDSICRDIYSFLIQE